MYIIKFKGAEYTLPKANIVAFAQFQALENRLMTVITSDKSAIEFLNSLGMEVY